MSYYIGATGEYIWEELLDNTTSNVIISNHINFDAGPLTDAIQETITDALGTAVGELIAPITEVPSATGVGVVALTALGLLSYYKLNRTAVQDVDSMVYSADYASILTPGMFDDRVRIRYDTNQFSNAFYNVDSVKKGEILTSRINLLPAGVNDIDLYTNTGKVGIGTTPETQLHIYKGGNQATNIIRLETPVGGSSSIEFKRGTEYDAYADFRLIGATGIFRLQYEDNELAYGDVGTDIIYATKTQVSIYKPTSFIDNVGIGTATASTQLHIYNEVNPSIRIQSIAAGTPIIELMRGNGSDSNKDYRFISESDTFKLQVQDATTYYPDANNQLISINATDTIIHKQTEFKANVLVGGDTRTIGYVGIGTTASTALHVYTAAANILRLQTAPVNGTNSIEFMRGNSTDPLTDYRIFTNLDGKFKIQYANNLLAYGDAETDLIELSTTNTIIYKPTEMKGNVGIGTTPHATYKVDVVGTVNATAFIGDGANITALNEANLVLTTAKLYNNFNQTNFAIIDNKIDITPNYSINITDYDSQTLFGLSVERKYKGKMTANYDDRNGVYKLITTNNRTDNVAVLNYKVGDKISIRNTATVANDYLLESGSRYYNSLLLIKRPNNIPLNWAVNDAHNVLLYEWNSSDGLEGRPEARVRTPTNRYFPFTTVMTFLIEAGFNYYLCKLYNTVEVSGSSLIVVASGYGDDYNDFNRAFGAGQTFKLQITGTTFADDYLPTEYIGADIGIASDRRLGGVKKGRGVAIDATTGALDATPVSDDLINSMNTSHFTNNTGTGKIDMSSTYVAPSATKLATARNIAGVSFDGSGAIDIPYFNLIHKIGVGSGLSITTGSATTSPNITLSLTESEIPNLGAGKITSGTFDIARIPDLGTAKITSGTFDIARIPDMATGKITSGTFDIARIPDLGTAKITSGTFDIARIPDLGTAKITSGTFDIARIPDLGTAKITSGTFDIARIPDLGTGKITSGTFDIARIPDLGTGKITSGTFATDRIPALPISKITDLQTTLDGKQATLTSANTIGIFNTTQFENVASKIQIKSSVIPAAQVQTDWNATTGMGVLLNKPTILTMTDINNTSNYVLRLDGHTSNYVARVNTELLTAMGSLQPTINSTAGQLIIGNGNGFTTTSTGLTWAGGTTNRLTATNIATTSGLYPNFIDCTTTIRGEELRVFGYGLVVVGNSSTLMRISNNTNNELRVQQTLVAANDVKFSIFQRDNNVEYATPNITFYKGVIGIGTTTPATYPLTVGGDINITGNYRVNGALLDYFALNNRPIILQPTTTNLQLVSGYTFSVPSNLAVGTTAIATNILQVGAGGRLRISNGTTDYTLLGTLDTDGSTNTSIVLSGNTRSTNAGNIQYLATASGGSHIFYTASATTRMTISSSGVNVNNDLGVTGNVGIGVAPSATYKLNVNGSLNATSLFLNGSAFTGSSQWTTSGTKIYYNGGNVGIGTTDPTNRLHILNSSTGNNPDTGNVSLYVYNPTNSAGHNSVIINRIAGSASGRVLYGFDVNAAHGFSIYMTGNNSALRFNNGWDGLGTDRMIINNNGNVGIGVAPSYKAHIKCSYNDVGSGLHLDADDGNSNPNKYSLTIWPYVIANGQVGWRFRTQNETGGTHTPLTLNNYGNVEIAGNLNCANINCNNSYVLGTEVYARNSYDTRIRSDSGGMYLEMSGIGGSGEFLKLGAFVGMTAIDSGAGRMLRMRIGTGLSWEFNTNSTTWNAKGSTTWDAPSDHRIKEDIKKANLKICYDNVKNINLYRFKYIDGFKEATKQDRTQLGYIAQQVKQHFPKSVQRSKTRIEDKREIPDLASVDISQVNFTLFGAVKQLMRVVEKQSKRIKKLEEMLNIIDDDAVEDDADEPYVRMNCEDEVDIDTIEPSEPTEV